jgi:uncharacterized protein (TIGR02466 family)
MAKVKIFNESLIVDTFHNLNIDEEIYNILSLKEKNNKNVVKSNFGGFQTDSINNKNIVNNILEKCVTLITSNYKLKRNTIFSLKNLWINKNKKYNFNLPHVHPDSHFSGVYYLDVPKENGEILFFKDGAKTFIGLDDFIESQEFNNNYQIKPKKHMILLFPSSLCHMVKPHFEDTARISISFNIGLNYG